MNNDWEEQLRNIIKNMDYYNEVVNMGKQMIDSQMEFISNVDFQLNNLDRTFVSDSLLELDCQLSKMENIAAKSLMKNVSKEIFKLDTLGIDNNLAKITKQMSVFQPNYSNQFLENVLGQLKITNKMSLLNFNDKIFRIQKELIDKTYFSSINKISEDILRIKDFFSNSILENINVTELINNLKDLNNVNYSLNDDGTIVIDNDIFTLNELKQKVDDTIKEAGINQEINSVEEGINKLIKIINSIKKPVIKIILIPILVNILTIFITPYFEDIRNNMLNIDKRKVVRTIKKDVARLDIHNEIINNFRFVSTKCLNVRQKGKIKSPVIGKLYLGQVVRIIHKKRKWTLVEWVSKDGEVQIRGWVFTRYISRFK